MAFAALPEDLMASGWRAWAAAIVWSVTALLLVLLSVGSAWGGFARRVGG